MIQPPDRAAAQRSSRKLAFSSAMESSPSPPSYSPCSPFQLKKEKLEGDCAHEKSGAPWRGDSTHDPILLDLSAEEQSSEMFPASPDLFSSLQR